MKLYMAICCIFVGTKAVNGGDFTSPTNVALGQTATQSTVAWGGVASRAVDGDKNPDYNAGLSCTHTDSTVNNQHWWQVELGQLAEIFQVKIQNRDTLGSRLADFDILVGKTAADLQSCAYFEGPGADGVEYTINCSQPLIGKFIKIDKRDNVDDLTLCEVEVMGWTTVSGCSEAGDQDGTYRIYPCGGHTTTTCNYDENGQCYV